MSERERAKDSEREGEVGALEKEKRVTLGIVGSPGFIGAFFEWLPYVLAYLDILISAAGLKMVGDLYSLLFGMNANSGIAGPTAAFTSFQSHWLK